MLLLAGENPRAATSVSDEEHFENRKNEDHILRWGSESKAESNLATTPSSILINHGGVPVPPIDFGAERSAGAELFGVQNAEGEGQLCAGHGSRESTSQNVDRR